MDTKKSNFQDKSAPRKHRVVVLKDESFAYGPTKKNFFRGQIIELDKELYVSLKQAGIVVDAP